MQEESNTNQLVAIDIDDDATKQIEHERQSQESNDSLEMHHTSDDENSVATDADDRGIKPIDYIDESQDIKDSFNENNLVVVAQDVIPVVLLFHDVAYLEFDRETQLSVVSQSLRTEIISRGSILFQNKDFSFAVPGGRSITRAWFMRRLANGDEVNRSWLLY